MGTLHHLHERRARPDFHCAPIEEKLPETESPLVIYLCIAACALFHGGCLVLLITGGY